MSTFGANEFLDLPDPYVAAMQGSEARSRLNDEVQILRSRNDFPQSFDQPGAGSRRQAEGNTPAEARQLAGAEPRQGQAVQAEVSALLRNLGGRDTRAVEQSMSRLREIGPAALPQIWEALDRSTTTADRDRCTQVLNSMKTDGFLSLLDSRSHEDTEVRNATARLLGTMSNRELLETAGRFPLELTQARLDQLRSILLARDSERDLTIDQFTDHKHQNVGENDLRRYAAFSLLFVPERTGFTLGRLGAHLASQGPESYAAAQPLLERAAEQRGCPFSALHALATIHHSQGNYEDWLRVAQTCMTRLDNGTDDFVSSTALQAYEMFVRQGRTIPAEARLTVEQRQQIQNMSATTVDRWTDLLYRGFRGELGRQRD
jgi:hypothetical protein